MLQKFLASVRELYFSIMSTWKRTILLLPKHFSIIHQFEGDKTAGKSSVSSFSPNHELNLQSRHLERATIDIMGLTLTIKFASNKLKYFDIGPTDFSNFHFSQINASVICKSEVLFNEYTSTFMVSRLTNNDMKIFKYFPEKCNKMT